MRRVPPARLLIVLLVGTGAAAWYWLRAAEDRRLVEARARLGKPSSAAWFDELARDHPASAEVQFLAGRQARLEGRIDEARARLARAASLGWPTGPIERERLLALATVDFQEARPTLEEYAAARPGDREAQLALAEGELRTGRAVRAQERVNRLLHDVPDDPLALAIRGVCWQQARRHDLARADLEAAVAAGPDTPGHSRAQLALATCLLDLGEFRQALEAFQACCRDKPDNPLALFGVGRAATFMGRADEAEEAFRKVLTLHPGHVETLLALAQLHEQRGRTDRALATLEEAEKREPERVETHLRLAKLLAALGREELAAAHEARFRDLNARQLRQMADAPEPGGPLPPPAVAGKKVEGPR